MGASKPFFMECLCMCMLGPHKTCLTVGSRQTGWSLSVGDSGSQCWVHYVTCLSPHLLFSAGFFSCVFKSVYASSTRNMHTNTAQPLVATELIFIFLNSGIHLSWLWLKESQKHYNTFNHANLDHFLLTAWHLFRGIVLNRLLQRSYPGLLKRGNAIQI